MSSRAVVCLALLLGVLGVSSRAIAARSQAGGSSYSGTIASSPVSASPTCAVFCWCYADDATADYALVTLNNSGNDTDYAGIDLRGDVGGDPVRAFCAHGGSVTSALSASGFAAAGWLNVGGALESGATTVYFDGVATATAASQSAAGLNRITLGAFRSASFDPANDFSGRMGYACVWSAAPPVSAWDSLNHGQNPRRAAGHELLVFCAPMFDAGSSVVDVIGGRVLSTSSSTALASMPSLIRGGGR